MKQCAIILNGKDIVKVANLKRKYNKFVNNPDVKILEECDEDQLEEKYKYWCHTVKPDEEPAEKPLKYHWRNKFTGWTRHSINPQLGADANPDEWEPYDEQRS